MSNTYMTWRNQAIALRRAFLDERAELVKEGLKDGMTQSQVSFYRGYLAGLRHGAQLSGIHDVDVTVQLPKVARPHRPVGPPLRSHR